MVAIIRQDWANSKIQTRAKQKDGSIHEVTTNGTVYVLIPNGKAESFKLVGIDTTPHDGAGNPIRQRKSAKRISVFDSF